MFRKGGVRAEFVPTLSYASKKRVGHKALRAVQFCIMHLQSGILVTGAGSNRNAAACKRTIWSSIASF